MDKREQLRGLINEDPYNLLQITETAHSSIRTEDTVLKNNFEDIVSFYEENGKEPSSNLSNIYEYQLYCRLKVIRDTPAMVVTVVIIGIQKRQDGVKLLYHGDELIECQSIGPYLIPDSDTIVNKSNSSLFNVLPSIRKGNMPYDNGHLLINSYDEYLSIVNKDESAHDLIKRIVGSEEFINSIRRWCLWIPALVRIFLVRATVTNHLDART